MTTRTIRENGTGNHLLLAAALLSAVAGDVMSIEGSWSTADTASCIVADDNITIQTDAVAKHAGFVDNVSHYRLEVEDGNHCITVNNTGCLINGLVIKQNAAGGSDECIRVGASGVTLTLDSLLLYTSEKISYQDGVYAGNISCTVNATNCIGWGFGRSVFNSQHYNTGSDTQTWNINSCFMYNNGRDSADDGGIVSRTDIGNTAKMNIFNTISIGNTRDYQQNESGNHLWTIRNSIDSDGSIALRDTGHSGCLLNRTITDNHAPGAGNWVIVNDITLSVDLRLFDNATDNDAQDAHSDATGAGLAMPTTDITGSARSAPFCISAFQIVSGFPLLIITAQSINTAEQVGNLQLSHDSMAVFASSILSAENVETPVLLPGLVTVSPDSILSNSQVGNLTLTTFNQILATSIASTQSIGSATFFPDAISISPGSIFSLEVLGNILIQSGSASIYSNSIFSAENIGSAEFESGPVSLSVDSINSTEQLGNPTVLTDAVLLSVSSIASAEVIGGVLVSPGAAFIAATGINSVEILGDITLLQDAVLVTASGISSTEAFGNAEIIAGTAAVVAESINSTEQLGNADVTTLTVLSAAAIASLEAVGSAEIIPGDVQLFAQAVTSSEAVGLASIELNDKTIIAVGIDSAEAVGLAQILGGVDITGWLDAQIEVLQALDAGVNITPALIAKPEVNRVH